MENINLLIVDSEHISKIRLTKVHSVLRKIFNNEYFNDTIKPIRIGLFQNDELIGCIDMASFVTTENVLNDLAEVFPDLIIEQNNRKSVIIISVKTLCNRDGCVKVLKPIFDELSTFTQLFYLDNNIKMINNENYYVC